MRKPTRVSFRFQQHNVTIVSLTRTVHVSFLKINSVINKGLKYMCSVLLCNPNMCNPNKNDTRVILVFKHSELLQKAK